MSSRLNSTPFVSMDGRYAGFKKCIPGRPGLITDVAASELRVGAQYDWPGLHLAYLGEVGKPQKSGIDFILTTVEDVGTRS